MPYQQTVCVQETEASSTSATTTCDYTQSSPLVTYDVGILLGLTFIIAFMAANFIRNVFYR